MDCFCIFRRYIKTTTHGINYSFTDNGCSSDGYSGHFTGNHSKNFWSSLVVAIVIALLNSFLLPVMVFITIPITIITFGLFLFVLNAFIIWLASAIVKGFYVENFWWALAFAIILSLFHSLFGISGSQFKLM